MRKKEFSVLNPFKRIYNYVIGGKGGNQPIQILNYTLADFNKFVDSIDKISGEGSGYIKVYYNGNAQIVKGIAQAIIENWKKVKSAQFKTTGGEHVSINVEGNSTDTKDCRNYLATVVNGGHIVEMLKSVPDGAVVSSSKYGRQSNGNCYMFGKDQTIVTEQDKNEAEDQTGTDVDGDGYVGDPANGKKAEDQKTEDSGFSYTTILIVIVIIVVIAALIKRNK